jgi:hypothetical protein
MKRIISKKPKLDLRGFKAMTLKVRKRSFSLEKMVL